MKIKTIPILLLLISMILAHEDYIGECYPWIVKENDFFYVKYYKSSRTPTDSTLKQYIEYFTDIYDTNGVIVKKAVPREKEHSYVDRPRIKNYYVDPTIHGVSVQDSIWYFTQILFPKNKNRGKPVLVEAISNSSKVTKQTQLNFGMFTRVMDHRLAVDDSLAIVLCSKLPYFSFGYSNEVSKDLYFYVLNKNSGKKLFEMSIGNAAYIYMFPQASQFLIDKNSAYISWISDKKVLKLAIFDLISFKLKIIDIEDINEGNTKPSIEIIGDNILFAYHTLKNLDDWDSSTIKTIIIKKPKDWHK